MSMTRLGVLIIMVLTAAAGSTASAQAQSCYCLDLWHITWPGTPENCLFNCPGAWGLPGHTAGSISDNKICLYYPLIGPCEDPVVGYDNLRIDLSQIPHDSLCVCDTEAANWPYIYPTAATDGSGCTTFRFSGSVINMKTYPYRDGTADDQPWLQVGACQDRQLRMRSPDFNADCKVDLVDFVIFTGAFVLYPCGALPGLWQHYTVLNSHCAPCNFPNLSDFATFGQHFDHSCTEYVPPPQ